MGPAPRGTATISLDPTFGKFYLIRIGFTLGEPVPFVKVFRLGMNFFGVQSVWIVGRCTTSYLFAGPARL